MQRTKKNILPFFIILLWALLIPVIAYVSAMDAKLSIVVFGAVIGLGAATVSLLNYKLGYYILITVSMSVHVVERLSGAEIPVGVLLDGLLLIILTGAIFNRQARQNSNVDYLRDPLLIVIYLYTAYLILQVVNPNMYSVQGWLIYIRVFIRNLIFLFLTLRVMQTEKDIRNFFKYWLVLSTLAAMYGCLQQVFDLLPYERAFIARYPDKFKTVMLAGGVRKFSFMADPAAFGVLMACTSIINIVLLTASNKIVNFPQKVLLVISLIFHLLSLGYSGTRTAYVMLPMGLLIFFLVNLHNRNTVIIAAIFGMGMGAILFGPFYGNATVVRIRTAFIGSNDESMSLRDVNRHNVQPYIHSHPIGGGVMTAGNDGNSYNPGHPLAGVQPDSGYLHVALELGYVGLIIVGLYLFMGILYAIRNYFASEGELNRLLLISIVAVMFAIIVAQYAQEAAGLVETSVFLNVILGITIKVKYNLKNPKHTKA